MGSDERIVAEIGPGPPHPVNFTVLANTQSLPLVEAPDPLQKPLTAEHLMEAGDAATKAVGGVEVGAVAIGDGHGGRGEGCIDTPRAAALEERDGRPRVDGPMPKEPTDKPQRLPLDVERRDEISDD